MRGRGFSFHGPVNSGEAGGHRSKPKLCWPYKNRPSYSHNSHGDLRTHWADIGLTSFSKCSQEGRLSPYRASVFKKMSRFSSLSCSLFGGTTPNIL